MENLRLASQSPGQDFHMGCSECEAGVANHSASSLGHRSYYITIHLSYTMPQRKPTVHTAKSDVFFSEVIIA
jgi:hypothetical protein